MSSISLYRPVIGTSNPEPMKQCGGDDDEAPKGDMDRVLGLASLGFGMLAALVLAVSVGVDYWLLTSEPWPTSSFTGSGGDQSAPDVAAGGGSASVGLNFPSVVMTETHSGLWRACIFAEIESASTTQATDVDQPVATISTETGDAQSAYGASEEAEYDDDDDEENCSMISYFGQGPEKIEGSETSSAIWRGIRKATPAIMVSLLLMISAEVLAVLGFLRQDFRTVVGAILSIIAALSLALGQIFYISVVNDEASQWKRPEGAKEQQTFKYGYGWAFYSAGSSFIIVMIAAVGHITVYLRRYVTNDVRRMLIIVPGLDIRKLTATSSTPAAGTTDRGSGAGLTGSSTSNSPTSPVAEEPNAPLPTENNGRIATSHVTSGSVPFIADTMTSSPGARGGIVGYRRAAFMSGLEAPLATGSQSMQSVIY